MVQQTATDWLAEKYNYITWMRNRDEMSAETADKLRAQYLEQAKQMEKEQHRETFKQSRQAKIFEEGMPPVWDNFDQYYNETYGTE